MDQLFWLLEADIKSGKLEDLKALMSEMVASTRSEPGTIAYEWYINEDGTKLKNYERFTGSDAALQHLGAFGENFAGRFLELIEPTGFTVYGDAGSDLREGLAALGAVYLAPLGGFAQ